MIRRKVFSYVEPEEERLYSTGNDMLDDLLERAFSEGYEYAQYEFSEKEDNGGMSTAAKIGVGSAAAVATTLGGLYAGKKGLLGGAAQRAINKGVMNVGRATNSKKIFDMGKKDFAEGVLKKGGMSASKAAKSDRVGKASYAKARREVMQDLDAAWEMEQAAKNVKNGNKGPKLLN